MNSDEKKIILFTSFAHYLAHFYMLVFPVLVMPIGREFHLSPGAVVEISFPMYLLYGLMAIPWGGISDKYEPRWAMGAGIIIAGCGFIASGYARTSIELTVCLCLIGLGSSAYHPAGMALLSRGVRLRGRALGLNGICGNFGIASAPLVAGSLCYYAGWDTSMVIVGCAGIVCGVACIAVPFSAPQHYDLQQGTAVVKQQAVLLFILLCCVMLFSGLLYRGYTVILPVLLESRLKAVDGSMPWLLRGTMTTPELQTLIASLVTGGVYLAGMAGQLLGGRIADRCELRLSYLAFYCCALPFLLSLQFLPGFMTVPAAGMFAFFALGMQPVENSLVAMLTPPRWRSVSYGVKFTIVFGAGSLSVILLRYVEAHYGLDDVTLLLAAYLVMAIFIICILVLLSRGMNIRHLQDSGSPVQPDEQTITDMGRALPCIIQPSSRR